MKRITIREGWKVVKVNGETWQYFYRTSDTSYLFKGPTKGEKFLHASADIKESLDMEQDETLNEACIKEFIKQEFYW